MIAIGMGSENVAGYQLCGVSDFTSGSFIQKAFLVFPGMLLCLGILILNEVVQIVKVPKEQ